ncbi:MAG: flagellar biosynthetic protein FliR [Spirochaetia bacterium]|jgi:flagellar biosynthetic protein FliR
MIEALVTHIRLFLLVFFRIIAIVELAPLLSSSSIPQMAKVGMSFFVAAVIFPTVLASPYAIPEDIVEYILLVLGEVAIGLLIGFLLNLIFSAFQLAGQFFSLQMGFSASEVFDPLSQVEIPLMGEFLNLIGMMVFITTTGMQKLLLVGVQRSFQSLRAIDLVTHKEGIITLLINGLAGLFQSALTISFPILGTLLLVSIVMGLLARAAPQMDILTMGFPISIAVSFLILFATLPMLMTAMERIIDGSFQTLSSFISMAGVIKR